MLLLTVVLFSVFVSINAERDCFPWDGLTQSACLERECIFLPGDPDRCIFNDEVCPSEISESNRLGCPNGAGADNKADCLDEGCAWCETETEGVPSCFYDDDVNQGGPFCPHTYPVNERIDCHPDPVEPGDLLDQCIVRGCYFCSISGGAPACFVPQEHGYRMVGVPEETSNGYQILIRRAKYPSWFGSDINVVQVNVEFQADERLRIKFSDPNPRWEVPLPIESPGDMAPNPLYDVQFESDPVFSISVIRKSTGATIFDTSLGGLVFSDQFIQFSTFLNTSRLYGFGEHEHLSFGHDMNFVHWPMFAQDNGVDKGVNLYGHHPVYMNIEETSDAHMVLILNSNAAEVVTMPAPGLVYRTIGGILDIYFFLGPQPDVAVQQYVSTVGLPMMVPYWSLGFQLSRFGEGTINDTKTVVDRMRQYDIPHDIQYGGIDYMHNYRDFTIDPVNYAGLSDYVDHLRNDGTRFIILLDPGIWSQGTPGDYLTYDRGSDMDVYIKDSVGDYQQGTVRPGLVNFPDYTNPNTETWWENECVLFKNQLDYSGLWLDMNEPTSYSLPEPCANNSFNMPLYVPRNIGALTNMTVCMDNEQYIGKHYDVHSLYGWSMAKQTLPAARVVEGNQKRSLVFSRSTFPGAGQWSQHWLGDNSATWQDLRLSIIGMMEFNMFGYPYVGADICGFNGEPSAELCQRWHQLGAFYTFSRNHNEEGYAPQDPGYFGSEVARVTRETLHIRYTLLPYLYTLMYNAHTTGSPVIKPLMFEFTDDDNTVNIDGQFMWGQALLISPVLERNTTSIVAYFPDSRWYSYYNGKEVAARQNYSLLDAPFDFIPLHVRGGHILPTQRPANTTATSRNNPFGLIAALDDDGEAKGSLFWDDGEELDSHLIGNYYYDNFICKSGVLTHTVDHIGYLEASDLKLDDIRIFGAPPGITSISFIVHHEDWFQDPDTNELVIQNANIPMTSKFEVTWS